MTPYPTLGPIPARDAVARMAAKRLLSEDERRVVAAFIGAEYSDAIEPVALKREPSVRVLRGDGFGFGLSKNGAGSE